MTHCRRRRRRRKDQEKRRKVMKKKKKKRRYIMNAKIPTAPIQVQGLGVPPVFVKQAVAKAQ
jgi:hypothetical protein